MRGIEILSSRSKAPLHEKIGVGMGYGLYVVAGALVGLVRLAIAVTYMAIHFFKGESAKKSAQSAVEQRTTRLEDRTTARTDEAKKKTGLKGKAARLKATIVNGLDELKTDVKSEIQETVAEVEADVQQAKDAPWKKQLLRGAIEMIPIAGALYYMRDDYQHRTKERGFIGLNRLIHDIKTERALP